MPEHATEGWPAEGVWEGGWEKREGEERRGTGEKWVRKRGGKWGTREHFAACWRSSLGSWCPLLVRLIPTPHPPQCRAVTSSQPHLTLLCHLKPVCYHAHKWKARGADQVLSAADFKRCWSPILFFLEKIQIYIYIYICKIHRPNATTTTSTPDNKNLLWDAAAQTLANRECLLSATLGLALC